MANIDKVMYYILYNNSIIENEELVTKVWKIMRKCYENVKKMHFLCFYLAENFKFSSNLWCEVKLFASSWFVTEKLQSLYLISL